MPLHDLVEYFNQRLRAENGSKQAALHIRQGQVESRFGDLRLATEFHPVRRVETPHLVVGHDAALQAFTADTTSQAAAARVFHVAEAEAIVNLDRLVRTIHMLNYLPIAHENGCLFLHVHPRHVLGVSRDHGAYFEEVIFRCGLSPRRVVITVPITPVYDRQLSILLNGLKNYQDRGYGTAIKFDEQANEAFLERYCIEFLYRITPDFVRLDKRFFSSLREDPEAGRRKRNLLSVIHRLDTEFLVEGVEDARDVALTEVLGADLVAGAYYERLADSPHHQRKLP